MGVLTLDLGMTLPPTVDEYERWLRRHGLSQSTIHERVRFAERRHAAWGTWDITTDQVVDWLNGYTGWTRRTYHSHFVSLFRWLIHAGHLAESPVADLRYPHAPKPRPNPLTPAEARRVIDTAVDVRLRAWLLLGMYAGLRAHEIAKIHGRDVTETAIYVLGKGGQGATIPTHPVIWEVAVTYPTTGYWFPSPQRGRMHISGSLVGQLVAAHFRGLGLTGSIHRTRATYGTNLLRTGSNIRIIQDLLRHESLMSTQHYLGVSEVERSEAIRRLAA